MLDADVSKFKWLIWPH